MYMGGNGFYWVISFSAEKPWVMEVRRGENGVRAWQAWPGETSHSTTGEKGGIWRNRGRAPQKLFGTGFASEGYGGSFHYHRMPDGERPEVSWIFDGVRSPELIGDYGLVGGGASGQEIDRAQVTLGTPPHTYLLASAQNQNDSYKVVPEDFEFTFDGIGGTEHPDVRADLTYFETPGGGAVFATSSIAWSGSLSHAVTTTTSAGSPPTSSTASSTPTADPARHERCAPSRQANRLPAAVPRVRLLREDA